MAPESQDAGLSRDILFLNFSRLWVRPVHLADSDCVAGEGEAAWNELPPGQRRLPVCVELHLAPAGGQEADPHDPFEGDPQFLHRLLGSPVSGRPRPAQLQAQLAIIHRAGDSQGVSGPHLPQSSPDQVETLLFLLNTWWLFSLRMACLAASTVV